LIKRKIREDVRKFNDEITEEIIEKTWSTKKVGKTLSEGICLLPSIKDRNGTTIYDRSRIVEEATCFYEDLYKDSRSLGDSSDNWREHVQNNDQVRAFSVTEVEHVLGKLKRGRAPGPDGIDNNSLRLLNKELAPPP